MDFLAADGRIFLHGDDEFLSRYKSRPDVIFYGRSDFNAYRPLNEQSFGLDGSSYEVKLCGSQNGGRMANSPGAHMVLNSLAAVAVGDYLEMTASQIAAGLAKLQLSSMRMAQSVTKSGFNLIADCYNANPDSMRAALAVLAQAEGYKVAILGDMRELGEISREKHFEIGVLAAGLDIDKIICVGKESYAIYEGFESIRGENSGNAMYFENKEKFVAPAFKPGDTILVKASRGLKFEEIVKTLEEI
jgi:UDP-N-acetylmuramoyl-tripeptide--D-alanyl-D-alanine ligase